MKHETLSFAVAQYKALHRTLNCVDKSEEDKRDENAQSEEVMITFEDMMLALREVRPSAMKEVSLEVPKVKI